MSVEGKARLTVLVRRVMEDGVISEEERADLRRFYVSELLTISEVKEVLTSYIKALEKEAMQDGVLTAAEVKTIQNAVDQLHIPLRLLPPEILDIVTGKRKPD